MENIIEFFSTKSILFYHLCLFFGLMTIVIIFAVSKNIKSKRVKQRGQNIAWGSSLNNQSADDTVNQYNFGGEFSFRVQDVFSLAGIGTVVTGQVESGVITVGDIAEVSGSEETIKAKVLGIEVFRKSFNQAKAGENVGLILGNIDKTKIQRNQILQNCRVSSFE